MSHRILLTGASGYLGGDLLARLGGAGLPSHEKLFALVRNDGQAEAVKKYGAEPITFDTRDELAVRQNVVDNKITIVYFLIDSLSCLSQKHFIKALAEVKQVTGKDVHFLHTSGAKIFSSHAGAPTERPLLDTDPKLFDIQKAQKPTVARVPEAIDTNCQVIELSDKFGVRSYVFVPCIVYGKGAGFGNPISIQTVAIFKAGRGAQRVYKVDTGRPTWPVCHVSDNSTLFIEILRAILAGRNPGYGKKGYYLAASGSVAWDDIYNAMAVAMATRNLISDSEVVPADDKALERMSKALGCPKDFVALQLGGLCTFTAEHGKELGWNPQFAPEHIIEAADEEVEVIMQSLKD
ncbi:NAD(P)-binding protein [Pleurostoma richardsiae]|uniref:NAD(P)-binding protein n=1 Tax=Pleurostoma richardsiae TaxID=41990 RepID=A0AA38VDW6_9PEZI|nr:NAD(P)-binding protein [Pleurostoma richardsiae]